MIGKPMPPDAKVNILLVDDRPENLLTLEALLGDPDYALFTAKSGADALRHLMQEDFALILMDVSMPEMDGFETVQIIRRRDRSRHIPILFVTSIALDDANISKGYSVGGVDYILKPIVPEILRAKVSIFVELYRKTRQVGEQAAQLAFLNDKLSRSLQEQEQRNRDLAVLSEMGGLLQTCISIEETYAIIGRFAQTLFPEAGGLLGIVSESHNLLESVAEWGDPPTGAGVFSPSECWALRSGRPHLADRSQSHAQCAHVGSPPPPGYLCLPLSARGKMLGLFHLRYKEAALPLPEERRGLAITFSEQVGMSLANVRLWEMLRRDAIRDPLTGLFNRRYLEETLVREIEKARRLHHSLGVIMFDIDHFKRFNDTFGHDAGDAVLVRLGRFVMDSTRISDVACRYGGEEFIIIMADATLGHTLERAEKLREGVKHLTLVSHGQSLENIRLSLGVAAFPGHGATGPDLLRAADVALYNAKKEGRDRVVVAEEEEGPKS